MNRNSFAGAAVVALAMVGIAGCHVTAEPEPVTVTSADVVPANIEAYPSTTYEGRPVYLYNDRWYYRDNGRWTYYQNPPPALVRQRPYVQQAPPARPGYGPGYNQYNNPYNRPDYGPSYNNAPPSSAPPATRVQ